MRKSIRLLGLLSAVAGIAVVGATQLSYASDHDDGETDMKSRALNLTDHFAFVDGTNLVLTMYFNPRSLPDTQYTLSTNARYEFHMSKAATATTTPTVADDYVFRFEAGAGDASGVQAITLTAFAGGAMVGTNSGMSTDFANSKANTVTTNTATVSALAGLKYFVGMRADAFHFDVIRFFQVRSFLANRFFGGPGGVGNASAALEPNCRGDSFFSEGPNGADGDAVNLWNPPSCAPDFTKNYNVEAIVLSIPLADLGGTIFDTWSIVTVKQ